MELSFPKIKWWFKSHTDTKPVVFVGWIAGREKEESFLKDLGVTGQIMWHAYEDKRSRSDHRLNPPTGVYEHCIITMDIAKKLKEFYPYFSSFVFTGLDKNGKQTAYQPLWKGEYD